MCGICGVVDLREEPRLDAGVFHRMREMVRHRGPDDFGDFSHGPAYLGFRRLSIVDLEGGHQPLLNEDGSLALVYNGEVYNHADLRRELEAKGHVYRSRSDSETVLHGYEEWGPAVLDRLRGMFAFAIYDLKRRRLFAARDRLGIKPLYYYQHGPLLVLGSEIKSLLGHPDVPRQVHRAAIPDYLTYRYVPGPETLFQGIRKLLPGHSLTFDESGLREGPYWDVSYRERFTGSYEEAYARVKELVTESVRLRLMSDVPLGALLSGGVDSSLIVGLMAGMMDRPVDTYSVGFRARGDYSELRYARMVSERFGTHHHELEVTEKDVLEAMPLLAWLQDEPVTEPSALPTYLISRMARRDVKVVLTGEGGDELFAGYAKYAHDRFSGLYSALPAGLRRALLRRLGASGRRFHIADRSLSIRGDAERWSSWFAGFDRREKAPLLSAEFARETASASSCSSRVFARYLERVDGAAPLQQMLYVDTKVWLPDDLLMKMDKMSMGASLEARVPLLDHLLVEFAATLPPHYKLRGMSGKIMLKAWAREMLPREVVDRRKVGFTVPVREWFRGGLREPLCDALLSERARSRGYFDPDHVRRLLDEHLSGRRDHARGLWTLMQLEVWHRTFVDQPDLESAAPAELRLTA